MNNREIKALTPNKAREYLKYKYRWRAVWYGRVRHYFIRFTAPGWPPNRGDTICGKDLPEYDKGDIKNDFIGRKCPACERKVELLEQRAREGR